MEPVHFDHLQPAGHQFAGYGTNRNNSQRLGVFQKQLYTFRTPHLQQYIQLRKFNLMFRQSSFHHIERPRTVFSQDKR